MKRASRLFILVVTASLICIVLQAQTNGQKEDNQPASMNLLQYGALGAIVVAGGWYILFLHKLHAKQMEAKDKIITEHTEKMLTNFEKNTTVLTELKTLIQQDILIKRTP